MVGENPAIHSVMLTRTALRELMLFALLSVDRCALVLEAKDGALVGLVPSDEYYETYLRKIAGDSCHYTVHRYPENAHPSIGGRNTHAMSGRTV